MQGAARWSRNDSFSFLLLFICFPHFFLFSSSSSLFSPSSPLLLFFFVLFPQALFPLSIFRSLLFISHSLYWVKGNRDWGILKHTFCLLGRMREGNGHWMGKNSQSEWKKKSSNNCCSASIHFIGHSSQRPVTEVAMETRLEQRCQRMCMCVPGFRSCESSHLKRSFAYCLRE